MPETLLKRFQHRCFPVKFEKFLTTSFSTEYLQWPLLDFINFNEKYLHTDSLGSSTESRRKVRVYRRNWYKLFIWVLVKKKKLGGHYHDLHMCPNLDIFKVVDLYLGQVGE